MNTRHILLCLALSLLGAGLQAQTDLPQVFSPNAAELGKYGKIPVSYVNGLPNITIPLTELRAKNYTLPIYLTYHAGGIQTEQMPSWVGLGWTLHAGGSINRIINGEKDEMEIDEAIYRNASEYETMQITPLPFENPGYLYHRALVQNETTWISDQRLRTYCDYEGLIDYEPDEFQVNIEGIQASFYFDAEGIRIVSQENVNFDISFELDTLRNHELKRWNANEKMIVQYFQYIKSITLTDRSGTRYVFGGDFSNIEFSYRHYKQGTTQRFIGTANTWHLARIEFPMGERILFNYEKEGMPIVVTDTHTKLYVCKVDKVYNAGNPITNLVENYTNESEGTNLEYTFLHPSYLVSVRSEMTGDHLEFLRERSLYEMDFQVSKTRLHAQLGNLNDMDTDRLVTDSFFLHLHAIEGVRSRIAFGHSQYVHPLIYWTSSDITPGTGPSLTIPIERLRLTSLSFSVANGEEPAHYFFKYNRTRQPQYNSKMSDHWGYYNGRYYGGVLRDVTIGSELFYGTLLTQQFESIRQVDTSLVKAGILEKIIYPTGGSTRFIYEAHEYHREMKQFPFQLQSAHGFAGGVRIKSIIDSLPGKREVRTFDYHSSGILSGRPRYGVVGHGSVNLSVSGTGLFGEDMSIDTLGTSFRRYRMGSERHLNQLSTTNGNHVTYSKVTERKSDGSYTIYEYTNHQECPDELPEMTTQNVDNSVLTDRYTSNALGRGLLKTMTVYTTSGSPVLREEYTYRQKQPIGDELYTVTREDPSGQGLTVRASVCRIPTYFPALQEIVKRIYPDGGGTPIVEATLYEYDSDRQQILEERSAGLQKETVVTTYPSALNGQPYLGMVQRSLKNTPIATAYFVNDVLTEARRRTYKTIALSDEGNWYVPNTEEKAEITSLVDIDDYDPLSTTLFGIPDVIYQSYDRYGNLLSATTRDGLEHTFSWDSTGVYMIRNAKDSLAWEYEWEPNVGLTRKIDPRGIQEAYSYDRGGRLTEVANHSGEAIRSYSYTLATQSDEASPVLDDDIEELNPLHITLSPVVKWNGRVIRLGDWWNWIDVKEYGQEGKRKARRTLNYFDNLGRPAAEVQVGASPTGRDLISWIGYDINGRSEKEWNQNVFMGWNIIGEIQYPDSVYMDSSPFTLFQYDKSPLDRIRKVTGPGEAWHNAGKGVKSNYLTNTESVGTDSLHCVKYGFTLSGDTGIAFARNGLWPAGSLTVDRTEDEDGRTLWVFKDMRELTVLERRLAEAATNSAGAVYADTYYLYDSAGHLTAVLPPELSKQFSAGTWSGSTGDSPAVDGFAYQYRYDARGRMIAKKLPGAGWTYYVYDQGDRLVLTQDGNQRERGEWSFRLQDLLGRECLTGVLTGSYNAFSNPLGSVQVRAVRDRSSGNYGDLHGYTVEGLSLSPGAEVLTVNWWDDYSFLGREAGMDGSAYGYTAPGSSEPYGTCYEASATGLQTGHWSRTLGEVRDSGTVGPAVMESWYYDDHGRVVYHVKGYPSGRRIAERSGYDFIGNLTAVKRTMHDGAGIQEHTEEYAYTYDSWGRLQNTVHTLDGGSPTTLASNSYDSVGRLSGTQRGRVGATPGPAALSSSYTYNVRGWLTGINGSLFSETLTYETPRSGSTQPGQWGGNISGVQWGTGDSRPYRYDFVYDLLGRLEEASYGGGNAGFQHGRKYSYDLNGNLLGRKSEDGANLHTGVWLDWSWNSGEGNRPVTWHQQRYNPAVYNPSGPSQVADEAYAYDAVGNRTVVTDAQGDTLNVLRYNLLNLPEEYVDAGGDTVNYVYSADGEKLYVEENPSESTLQGTEYAANYRIDNGTVTMIHTDASYYTPIPTPAGTAPSYTHIWYLKDHLGNNRVLASGRGAALSRYHYDPYGVEISVAPTTPSGIFLSGMTESPYKYGGKEWSATTSTYDFEARYLSPSFHRFTTMDPMAEKYYSISPYAYCAGNPVRYSDPTGAVFTERSLEYVERLLNNIDERQNHNAERIAQLQERLHSERLSDKRVKRIQKQIGKLQGESSELENVRVEISALKESNQVYDIRRDNSLNINDSTFGGGEYRSGVTFDFETGVFSIALGDGSLGSLAHELKHAYQFEIGALSSGYRRDGQPFYDKTDEFSAYVRGSMFGNSPIGKLPVLYEALQDGPMDTTKLPSIILSSPKELQKLANRTHSAFRVSGITYFMQDRRL